MFKIDKADNSISRLEVRTFAELGFDELHHLQEWIAKKPDALGEPLLIIQKEFHGFGDTNERLDLLALDKSGNLVVIENKRDDSGRDVVWQTIKYASYCSTLTKDQIVRIFQNYLDYLGEEKDALEELRTFFEEDELTFDEIELNPRKGQRLMMVAANFRKEVTSAALWLLDHGIDVQCIKLTPYSLDDQLFLSIERVIPTPEAKDYMIRMAIKEAEEKAAQNERMHRFNVRKRFWEQALETFRKSSYARFDNIRAGKDHWLRAGSGMSGVSYSLIFTKNEARAELCLERSSREENKFLFDFLAERREAIEKDFGAPLNWLRLDDKKSSRINIARAFECYNEDNWRDITAWMLDKMIRLDRALEAPLKEAGARLKNRGN